MRDSSGRVSSTGTLIPKASATVLRTWAWVSRQMRARGALFGAQAAVMSPLGRGSPLIGAGPRAPGWGDGP